MYYDIQYRDLSLSYILFNDALNKFNLRLYGDVHMAKDHSDSERINTLGYSFRLAARVLLYALSHRHTTAFVHREIAQWVHNERSIPGFIAP